MINTDIKKENLVRWLLFVCLAAIGVLLALYAVFLLVQGGVAAAFEKRMARTFEDFSVIMKCALMDNPYSKDALAIYPPIAIIILYIPALISKKIIHLDNAEMIRQPVFWLSFVLFYGICLAACVPLLKRVTGKKGKDFVLLCLLLFVSGPLLFTLERGNVVISALVFLLGFLAFYKSENVAMREIALVCLALAGTIKIYPLVFGILLLRDKRWLASMRVALYFALFFLAPFLFFKGGFSNVKCFWGNLEGFSDGIRLLISTRNMSATGLIHKLFYVLGLLLDVDLFVPARVIAMVIIIIFCLLAAFSAFVTKDRFRVLLIAALCITLIPAISFYYAALFLIVPFLEYIEVYDKMEKRRRTFYLLFFVVVLCAVLRSAPMFLGMLLAVVLVYECVLAIKQFIEEKREKLDNKNSDSSPEKSILNQQK